MRSLKKFASFCTISVMLVAAYKRHKSWIDAGLAVWSSIVSDVEYVNGAKVSKAQLKLAQKLDVPVEHINYKAGRYYIDIAFPDEKIAVEYNGAIWHKDKSKDVQRAKNLAKMGWKVLIIQVQSGFPDVDWVISKIEALRDKPNQKYWYVVWGG